MRIKFWASLSEDDLMAVMYDPKTKTATIMAPFARSRKDSISGLVKKLKKQRRKMPSLVTEHRADRFWRCVVKNFSMESWETFIEGLIEDGWLLELTTCFRRFIR